MITDNTLQRYLDALIQGDRKQSRSVIEEVMQHGTCANAVYMDVIWPVMVEIEKLLRAEQITDAQEHLATRINRTIVDQLQNKLPRRPSKNKKVIISCAEVELQELGAQIIADLFESDGWDVKFLGGGLTNDDILSYVNGNGPTDILLVYGSMPRQAPGIRQLIDTIKGINAYPNMRIMVSGGLFNRADGLWQEIGADMFASNAQEAIQLASNDVPVQSDQRTLNKRKRKQAKAVETVCVN